MKKIISFKDIVFSKESVIDSFGRVFYYNGKVYRLISKESEKHCKEMFSSGILDELTVLGLIPQTSIESNLVVDGDHIILHHEKCSITKPYEWSFEMFKMAAIHILKVNEICNKYGYELKDGHPYNVTFHNGKPVFFDIGSITKKRGAEWCAKMEFIETTLLPLLLWDNGEYFFLRTFLETPDMYYQRVKPYQSPLAVPYLSKKLSHLSFFQIKRGKFLFKTKRHIVIKFFSIADHFLVFLRQRKNYHFFKIFKIYQIPSIEEISNFKPKVSDTAWMNYQPNLDLNEIQVQFPRYNRIATIVRDYCSDAKTMLDLAGNGGAFALFMGTKIIFQNITVTDYDENAINHGFKYFNENHIPINLVWMNCMLPCEYDDTVERLKSDIVFGLAITHHLLLSQGFSLDFILERFKSYTNKYVVIEFMPKGLWGGEDVYPDIPNWYTQEWFTEKFAKYFKILFVEQTEVNRVVYIGSV